MTKSEIRAKRETAFRYAYEYARYFHGIGDDEKVPEAKRLPLESTEIDLLDEYAETNFGVFPDRGEMIRQYGRWARWQRLRYALGGS